MNMISLFFALTLVHSTALAQPKYAAPTIALSSPKGRSYFKAHDAPDFWRLISFYREQTSGGSCSVASVAMVLNALRSRENTTSETKNLKPEELVEKVVLHDWKSRTFSKIGALGKFGVTLAQLRDVSAKSIETFSSQTLSVELVGAETLSLSELRKILSENERSDSDFMIANFDQKVFTEDQTAGHIAPIGAFDSKSDRVLILDPDREWYEPYWVPTPKLLEAMKTQDPESGKLRGLIWIRHQKAHAPLPKHQG